MKEIWKDIKGYEGLYQVSNWGRVKSLVKKVAFGRSYRITDEKQLIPHKQKSGYLRVTLTINNKPKYKLVHRLVAEAFIENPDNLPQVNHKDEVKTNNHIENLEWCDCKYNNNYGTHIQRQAQRLSRGVIAFKDGIEVMNFPSAMEAQRNGFWSNSVLLCCKGKYKQYKGYIWKYAS